MALHAFNPGDPDSMMLTGRREFLRMSIGGVAGFVAANSLFGRLAAQTPAAAAGAAAANSKAAARSVIQIWLWGGPCHLDTFDPKPQAGRDFCGAFANPLATNVDDVFICEKLVNLAKHADKYALLRGMTHSNNGHETAAYMVQTGQQPGSTLAWPSMGAVVSHFRSGEGGYKGALPAYITLTEAQGRFDEAGFMGSRYKPFATGGDPSKDPFLVEGIVCEGISPERQRQRRELLQKLDSLGASYADADVISQISAQRRLAYEMILGEEAKVFDLSREAVSLRERYGKNRLGQSCLLARRLVARGVPFVTINCNGWDTHKMHFQAMGRMLPQLDMAVATLLEDLAAQGLLESTIVLVGGEFGRTPRIDFAPPWNGGRGHYGKAFSYLLAGGGFAGGRVVGQTDKTGENVLERPIYPWDLMASIYRRLGIAPDARLPHVEGHSVPLDLLRDENGQPRSSGGLLNELV